MERPRQTQGLGQRVNASEIQEKRQQNTTMELYGKNGNGDYTKRAIGHKALVDLLAPSILAASGTWSIKVIRLSIKYQSTVHTVWFCYLNAVIFLIG